MTDQDRWVVDEDRGRRASDGSAAVSFLADAPPTADARRLFDDDLEQHGYVMNTSRLWAHQPGLHDALFGLVGQAARAAALTYRQRAILVTATAAALGDSYCSLAWGHRLAGEAGAEVAGAVLRGDDGPLGPAERALAEWARRVARDPNGTTAADVEALRVAGFDDAAILAVTTFVGLRLAFSTVNDALGARPDRELAERVAAPVRTAVTYGRPAAP